MKECGIRGLIDKETEAIGSLNETNARGFSFSHMKSIADALTNSNFISAQKVDTFLDEIAQARPHVDGATHEDTTELEERHLDTTELEERHLGDKNNFENVTDLKRSDDKITVVCLRKYQKSH